MSSISVFEEPVDMPCSHDFCRGCWEGYVMVCCEHSIVDLVFLSGSCLHLLRFLNLKIQEGEAHNIFCPAFDCYQLVPVEVIESVVSREMDKRYLRFDIKVMRLNTLAWSWQELTEDRRADSPWMVAAGWV